MINGAFLWALAVGAALSVQVGMNAALRQAFGHAVPAALANFAVGTAALFALALALRLPWPGATQVASAPWWAWFGGLLGAAYVAAVTVLGPRLGVALLTALVVAGQMLAALAIDHYGWLGLPAQPATLNRLLGAGLVVAGVVLLLIVLFAAIGKTMPQITVVERDYPNTFKRFTALGPLLKASGNGGKGIGWKTEHEVDLLAELNGQVLEEGQTQGMPKIDTDIDACETILMLAPETNGEVAVKAWAALEKQTGREHTHLALPKEDEKIRFRDVVSQPRKIISAPTWSGLESEKVCYNAGYTNVHELIPWRTLTGRQQLYQDHLWMRAFGASLCVYRPPVDLRTIKPVIDLKPNGEKQIVLNFITPHQKWGIHSTYTDNLLMLTLNRGGPVVWMSEVDAAKAGLVDNDWVEAYNVNGALTARVVVSQRIKQGTLFMYHAQEKIVNTPGSEKTGNRGGIHNSVTRATLKPTHMIGGYAQLSYGFNYYGTVGSNRDEFVIVRKMKKIDWLDQPATRKVEAAE